MNDFHHRPKAKNYKPLDTVTYLKQNHTGACPKGFLITKCRLRMFRYRGFSNHCKVFLLMHFDCERSVNYSHNTQRAVCC